LLREEIFSFFDREMGILRGKCEITCSLLSQGVSSEWNFFNRGSFGIMLDVIHIIFQFLSLFSLKVSDFHPLVELFGLGINFGIIDMNFGRS